MKSYHRFFGFSTEQPTIVVSGDAWLGAILRRHNGSMWENPVEVKPGFFIFVGENEKIHVFPGRRVIVLGIGESPVDLSEPREMEQIDLQ
jgi:hypothetical protein